MVPSIGVQVFWMIALGSTIGFIGHYVYRKRGVTLGWSVIAATAGAVIMLLVAHYASFDVPGMYGFLGSITFLFLTNVFLDSG